MARIKIDFENRNNSHFCTSICFSLNCSFTEVSWPAKNLKIGLNFNLVLFGTIAGHFSVMSA